MGLCMCLGADAVKLARLTGASQDAATHAASQQPSGTYLAPTQVKDGILVRRPDASGPRLCLTVEHGLRQLLRGVDDVHNALLVRQRQQLLVLILLQLHGLRSWPHEGAMAATSALITAVKSGRQHWQQLLNGHRLARPSTG